MAAAGEAVTPPSGNVDALIDRPRLNRLQIRLFAICAFVLFAEGYDLQALALAVPEITGEFAIAPEAFSIALSASLLGMAIGGAGFAPLGDRIGRKPMLVLAMVLTGISTLAALAFPNAHWIAACRLVTGIGMGITTVNASAMMSDYAPAKWRFMIMTVINCAVPLGAFSAAMFAPNVIEALSWRGIFHIGGWVPLAAAVVVWLAMPESLKWLIATRPGDGRIAAIAKSFDASLDPARLHLAPREDKARQSVTGLFSPSNRIRTIVAWLGTAAGAFCLYMMISWLPTLLRDADWSSTDALRGTAAVQFGGIFGGLLIAWAIDRRWLVPAVVAGYGCSSLVLVGAGISGMQGIWMSIAVGLYPLELRATSAGWMAAISRIGAVAAPIAGGLAVAANMEAKNLLMALVLPIGITVIAIILARRYFVPPPPVLEEGGTA